MINEPKRRATSTDELHEIQSRMMNPEDAVAAVRSFKPQATDVIIAPFGKCGTTWLQQTFHSLRTRGDMDFDDISRVVPWIETAVALGIDLNAPQRAAPRGFKSHLSYDHVPKGARYVVSLRDPKDAFVSLYRFMEGWFMEPGTISMEDFARVRFLRSGDGPVGADASRDYWGHLISWWQQRNNPDVLLFSYEQMTDDAPGTVERLAEFCGIPLDAELKALVLEQSSLTFMLKHKDKYDDLLMRQLSETRCNLPLGSDSAKVRKGGVGSHRQELPAAVAAHLDAIWQQHVTPVLGFADYAELDRALRARTES